jgi:hypothetical protein
MHATRSTPPAHQATHKESQKWPTIRYALAGWGRTARLVVILTIMQTPADAAGLWLVIRR